jgi:hypothetical protein
VINGLAPVNWREFDVAFAITDPTLELLLKTMPRSWNGPGFPIVLLLVYEVLSEPPKRKTVLEPEVGTPLGIQFVASPHDGLPTPIQELVTACPGARAAHVRLAIEAARCAARLARLKRGEREV